MIEADKCQWTPRATSIVCEGKTLWFSHSSFGAMLGVFYTKAQADYASYDFDIKLTINIYEEEYDTIQLMVCTLDIYKESKTYYLPFKTKDGTHPPEPFEDKDEALLHFEDYSIRLG